MHQPPTVIDPTDEAEVLNQWLWSFTNHTPSTEGIANIEHLRAQAKNMATSILKVCPNGREKSLALTALESALYSAIASIARKQTEDK